MREQKMIFAVKEGLSLRQLPREIGAWKAAETGVTGVTGGAGTAAAAKVHALPAKMGTAGNFAYYFPLLMAEGSTSWPPHSGRRM